MKRFALIALIAGALALYASLVSSAPATRLAVATIRCATPAKWRGTGLQASNWRISCQVCSSFSLRNLAHQYHVAARAVVVATKYAKTHYRLPYRQAAFEGCLFGIVHRR